MNPSSLIPNISVLAIFMIVIAVGGAGIVLYALRNKGDVRAKFSHGSTVFELEAKERAARRR